MKHSAIIAIVFVIGCATGGIAAQLVVPSARAGTSPTRWEYQCAQVGSAATDVTTALNRLGAEGWELASVAPADIPGGYRPPPHRARALWLSDLEQDIHRVDGGDEHSVLPNQVGLGGAIAARQLGRGAVAVGSHHPA
jgi:hypothetical protein